MKGRFGLTVVMLAIVAIGVFAVHPAAAHASCVAQTVRSNSQYVYGSAGSGVKASVYLVQNMDCSYNVIAYACTDGITYPAHTTAVNFYDYTYGKTISGASQSEPQLGVNTCDPNSAYVLNTNPTHGSDEVKAYGGVEGDPYVYTALYP